MTVAEIRKMLCDENEEVRRQGALAVSSLHSGGRPAPRTLKEVLSLYDLALGDDSWRVRKTAADGLLSLTETEKVIEVLFDSLGSQDNAGKRNSAQEVLSAMGKRALPYLLTRVRHKEHDVRKFIADILGDIGDASAEQVISRRLLSDPDENVRVSAAEALGKIGGRYAVPRLSSLVGMKGGVILAYTALESLSRLGKKGFRIPVPPLLAALKDPMLKKGAIDALGWSRDSRAIAHLLEGLRHANKAVREASLMALVNLSASLTVPRKKKLLDSMRTSVAGDTYRQVLRSLDSYTVDVQKAAIIVLGWTRREEAIPAMIRAGSDDEGVRDIVCASLEEIGERSLPLLKEILPTLDVPSRTLGVRALGGIQGEGAEILLLSFLSDEEAAVRAQVVLSLGRRFSRRAVPPGVMDALIRELDDADEEVQRSAEQALVSLGQSSRSEVIRTITHLPPHASVAQRKNSLAVIGKIGGREEMDHLLFALKDENPDVRRGALQSLGSLRYKEAVDHIRPTLADEDLQVRIASALALGEIGGGRVIESLALALKDKEPEVRCAVVRALRGFNGPGPEDAIRSALSDPHPLVAITALEALRDRGEGEFLKGLKTILSHPEEDVRREGVRTLARIRGREAAGALSLLAKDPDPVIGGEARRLLAAN